MRLRIPTLGLDEWSNATHERILKTLESIVRMPLYVPNKGRFSHIGAVVLAGEAGQDERLRLVVMEALAGTESLTAHH